MLRVVNLNLGVAEEISIGIISLECVLVSLVCLSDCTMSGHVVILV